MSAIGPPAFGAVAAWQLDIGVPPPPSTATTAALSFASSDYRGRVEATLDSGLTPGSYLIAIEGITETQFAQVKQLAAQQTFLCANLYLFWADATTGASLPDVTAVLRVTALRRRPGNWRYELHVEAREWVYELLGGRAPAVGGATALAHAQNIADACNVAFSPAAAPSGAPDPGTAFAADTTKSARELLDKLGADMAAEAAVDGTSKRGTLSMYQIRDGTLGIGPNRLDAAATTPPVVIDATSGLIAVERAGSLTASDDSAPAGVPAPPLRDQYVATLRGRPDLKPGDVIQLTLPEIDPSESDFDISLGSAPVSPSTHPVALIQEVVHRMSREAGFSTVVYCIAASTDASQSPVDRLWFQTATTDSASTAGSHEAQIARTIRGRPPRLGTAIAQVRQRYGQGDTAPMQSARLWRNTLDSREPHGAVRTSLTASYDAIDAVPYATPFAWGPFGLTVPRYPGMRVLLAHRNGNSDDPVDVGALWDEGTAPVPQPGDWWLSLPAAIAQNQRASVDDQSAPPQPTGQATNDLIDADGTRVIAVGKLTLRVGSSALTAAGTRPTASDPVVSIESGQATITIDQNGAISILSNGKLTLSSNSSIELDASSISMVTGSVAITKKTS